MQSRTIAGAQALGAPASVGRGALRDAPSSDAVPSNSVPSNSAPTNGAPSAAGARAWQARWPEFAEAVRAGTWGDGGRDY